MSNAGHIGCLLTADLTGDFGCAVREWVNWRVLLQLIDERAARDSGIRRVGAGHSVHEFSQSDGRHRDLHFSEGPSNRGGECLNGLPLPFCRDDYARIETQSQEGDSMAGFASLMPSSASLPKPPSKTAFKPLARADAMHSEIGRPERFGGLIVAR